MGKMKTIKPKAFFFDMDGTLLSNGQLPESAKEAVQFAKCNGALIFAATGRHKFEYENASWLTHVPFDGFITMNGAYCYINEKVIYKKTIHYKTVLLVLDYIMLNPFSCMFCEEHEVFVNIEDEKAKDFQISFGLPHPTINNIERAACADIFQIVSLEKGFDDSFIKQLPHCAITSWGGDCYDIVPEGVNKWAGILNILPYFNLNPNEIITIGDDMNDIEMLMGAGFSVAMGNSLEEVKNCADYVTNHVDDDGLLKAVKYIFNSCV